MSKYVINDTTLSAIGNAIKTKKGDSTPILVSNFATEIANLPSGGSSSQVVTRIPSSTSSLNNSNIQNVIAADLGSTSESDFQKVQSFFLSGNQNGSYSERPMVTYTKPDTETGYITATLNGTTWHLYPFIMYDVTSSIIKYTYDTYAIGYTEGNPNYMRTYYKKSSTWDNGTAGIGIPLGSIVGGMYVLEGE